ncbi:hypothetical protein E2C01_021318 [Portunus trituberculatus]|uniref:Uncharacterized protein n=1 Tax=Portunus trituberculatus TaxID=210409 RepID=A0A5B7E4D1_PORTR|nr:hypothetical protein [Portunus trituberculatus]
MKAIKTREKEEDEKDDDEEEEEKVAAQGGTFCFVPQPDGADSNLFLSHAHVQLCQYSVVVRAAHKSQLMTLKPVLLVVIEISCNQNVPVAVFLHQVVQDLSQVQE